MNRALLGGVVLALLLGGCSIDLNTKGICIEDRPQAWVGQVFTDRAADRIKDISRATSVRVQRPGEMVTMDFRKRRVNVVVDEAGRIARIYCG